MVKNNYKYFITLFITILCFITTLISVGFSALNQNLNISGDIDYEEDNNTLYGVLNKAANVGTYAKEYTETHHDSFTEEPTKGIYYWYGSNDTNVDIILDKWNVIFAGFCWQMYRTTDTGGVKLIYNGVPDDGKCNNTGTAQQIGVSEFNTAVGSLAHVGYMYNTTYNSYHKNVEVLDILTRASMTSSSNYYYGTGVTYSNGRYTLTGVTQDTWANTYSSSNGLYTCASTTSTSCPSVYFISGGNSSGLFGFYMSNGNLLNYYNGDITFGSGYTENNGIYTLTGTVTISKSDWYKKGGTYVNHYTCGDDSLSCSNIKFHSYASYVGYSYISSDIEAIYAKDFTYNSNTNTYTLGNDRVQFWDMTDNTNRSSLSTHHYTCLNNSGECSTLSYVLHVAHPANITYMHYINLTNGKGVDDAKNEMLYNDNVNTTNSTVKSSIDSWYLNNMTSYTSLLEDTIFCSNRATSDENSWWYPNGGTIDSYRYNATAFQCINDVDKFCLSNNKARLTYPVGLISYAEFKLLNSSNLMKTGQRYWMISPGYYSYDGKAYNHSFNTSGNNDNIMVSNSAGVRPVVSLKPGTEYVSGTGSKDDPYIVE